jgi:hypothetical protein
MIELNRLVAASHVGTLRAMDTLESALTRKSESTPAVFRWVWIVLIGVLVIAAAIAFVYCRNHGYSGFSGNIEWIKGPLGIRIGVKLGCY